MSQNSTAPNPNTYFQPGTFFQFPPQPYIAPGLSLPEANNKFLGVFTGSHLSICLLVSGFGLIVFGLLGVISRSSLDPKAFEAVGISLICFGSLLIIIAIAIFVFVVRWGRKKVHVLDRSSGGNSNFPISMVPIGYSVPVLPNASNTTAFHNLQNTFNNPSNSFANQTFYGIPVNNNSAPANANPQFILIRPSAPPQSPDSTKK